MWYNKLTIIASFFIVFFMIAIISASIALYYKYSSMAIDFAIYGFFLLFIGSFIQLINTNLKRV